MEDEGPYKKIKVTLLDSLVVDILAPLVIDDQSSEEGPFLMRGTKSRIPYLVSQQGEVIKSFDILDEGPDGVGASGAFGYMFLGEDKFVAQGLFNGYHIYNLVGKKEKLLPPNQAGLFGMSVFTYRTTFTPYYRNDKGFILGEEPNLYDRNGLDPKEMGVNYYQHAKTIFNYDIKEVESVALESYPEEWQPIQEDRYVGTGRVLSAYNTDKQELALLPALGHQLFIYDFSGEVPLLKHVVKLSHKNRPEKIPDYEFDRDQSYSDYPSLTELRYVGEKLLVGFYTMVPKDVMRQLRSQSEDFRNSQTYREAEKKFIRQHFMVVEGDKQIGVIDEFQVPGTLDFVDQKGRIYLNDNVQPSRERDYNVFYRLKID
ncbi:hypothetical protein [Pleomorphovibrio marinus]|uniref:hypothetical protein n=1 Tax=Pleomorphovibrio marinus TaxID=2164132 RepID=UPI0013002434|nr:hypothetical protein [Pleomorphovibrio marinus]